MLALKGFVAHRSNDGAFSLLHRHSCPVSAVCVSNKGLVFADIEGGVWRLQGNDCEKLSTIAITTGYGASATYPVASRRHHEGPSVTHDVRPVGSGHFPRLQLHDLRLGFYFGAVVTEEQILLADLARATHFAPYVAHHAAWADRCDVARAIDAGDATAALEPLLSFKEGRTIPRVAGPAKERCFALLFELEHLHGRSPAVGQGTAAFPTQPFCP
jgi:hypothetical protein